VIAFATAGSLTFCACTYPMTENAKSTTARRAKRRG
jgi:hypothetical protein